MNGPPKKELDMDDIYRTYERLVYQFLYIRTQDAEWAQELMQETFLRAVTSVSRYDGSCKLSVWLCQIAKHILYQELRKKNRTIQVELDESISDSRQEDAIHQVLWHENRMELYQAIHKLREQEREIVLYRITGEMSFREIGEILGKNENWARTNFYRAKLKIREELKKYEENKSD